MAKKIYLQLSDDAINELLDLKEQTGLIKLEPNYNREDEFKKLKKQGKGLGCLFG